MVPEIRLTTCYTYMKTPCKNDVGEIHKNHLLYIIHCYLGGGFKYFLFSPLFGEDYHFDEHIFQMGCFNHQPVIYLKKISSSTGDFSSPSIHLPAFSNRQLGLHASRAGDAHRPESTLYQKTPGATNGIRKPHAALGLEER